MKIADLKTPMTLQEKMRTLDGAGGYVVTYDPVAEIYCSIAQVAGREELQSHKTSAVITHRIIMRYRAGVSADMRLVDEAGAAYDIVSVCDTTGEKRFLELLAIT